MFTLPLLIVVKGSPHYVLNTEGLGATLMSSCPLSITTLCKPAYPIFPWREPVPVSALLFLPQINPCWPLIWKTSIQMYVLVQLAFLLFPIDVFCPVQTVYKEVPVVRPLCFQPFGVFYRYGMRPPFAYSQAYFSVFSYFQVSACVEKNWTLCCAGLLIFQMGLGQASFLNAVPHRVKYSVSAR